MITQNNSINDTGTNSIHMRKDQIILLPQTIPDIQYLTEQLSFTGSAFIIEHSAIIGTVFSFINILYSGPLSLSCYLDC